MPPTLDINLVNSTASDNVFAFITGLDIDNGNAWFLLKADGRTAYHPPNPSNVGTPLAENCAIQLGKSGSGRTVTIPHIAGGRIYFSIDRPLTFFLNPGQSLSLIRISRLRHIHHHVTKINVIILFCPVL